MKITFILLSILFITCCYGQKGKIGKDSFAVMAATYSSRWGKYFKPAQTELKTANSILNICKKENNLTYSYKNQFIRS